MSEMTDCDREGNFSEGSRGPIWKLRSEGSKSVNPQPQVRHLRSERWSDIPEIALMIRTPITTVPFRHPIGFIQKYFYTA